MKIQNIPIAATAMLIRKPVSEVFEAFVQLNASKNRVPITMPVGQDRGQHDN
jgi:hypothetical protein